MEGAFIPFTSVRLPEWDHLVLPALTLSLVSLGAIARITRASLIEAGTSEFLQTARAKGASRARVFVRHTLQNALIPVVTVIGMRSEERRVGKECSARGEADE